MKDKNIIAIAIIVAVTLIALVWINSDTKEVKPEPKQEVQSETTFFKDNFMLGCTEDDISMTAFCECGYQELVKIYPTSEALMRFSLDFDRNPSKYDSLLEEVVIPCFDRL